MAETSSFLFSAGTNWHRGRLFFVGDTPTTRVKLTAIFYLVLTVLGGRLTTVGARITERSSLQPPKPNHNVKCGPYAVCNLASHFCDSVMSTCIRCSDDCHPGRINGDRLAEEDCREKCKVYYDLKEEMDRLKIEKATTEKLTNVHHRSEIQSQQNLQLSVRSLNLISTADDLTLARVELLMIIETISVAVITVLLFVVSVCLIILLQRQRATTVYSYSSLDSGRKPALG